MTENNDRRKGLSQIILPLNGSTLREVRTGAQVRNLKAGTEAEASEECCLLASSQIHDQLAQGHLAKAVVSHSGLSSPTSGTSQDNLSQMSS